MVNGMRLLLQQSHLDRVSDFDFEPHIYMVCRRPRISIDPESCLFTETEFSAVFKKQERNNFYDIPVVTRNLLGTKDIKLISEFPYTEYELVDLGGEVISKGKSALLLASLGAQYWDNMDLEVLYIGQSYGKDGSRNAAERLTSHSTLQGIYAEAIQKSPDQEIWLLLWEFTPLLLASFEGRSKAYKASTEEDSSHIKHVLANDITEQQQINFTEAALIKYFQPKFNKIYKDSFPNPAHSTYSECYEIDLNMVCVELQTEDLFLRLWTDEVKPQWVHLCTFPLHSKEERMYMFEFDGKRAI